MAKFLHTADWHFGMKYSRFGRKAEIARKIRVETVGKLLESAVSKGVNFIIVAGDVFDSNDVSDEVVRDFKKVLEKVFPLKVYVLPGNHDPLTIDSVYKNPIISSIENCVVLKEKKPFLIPEFGVTLYPCPVTQKQSSVDPTEGLKKLDDSEIAIGIAHGNLKIEGFIKDFNFPILPERVDISGLDYLALGEWHSLFKLKNRQGVVKTLYPGTPEATKFGEDKSGMGVIVEIKEPGAEPVFEEIRVGQILWKRIEREISRAEEIAFLRKELFEVGEGKFVAVNLVLHGVIDEETAHLIFELEKEFSEKLLYFNIDKKGVHLKPNLVSLKSLIPEGLIFEKTVDALLALMKRFPGMQEYSELSGEKAEQILMEIGAIENRNTISPEVLEKAFILLFRLAKEVSR